MSMLSTTPLCFHVCPDVDFVINADPIDAGSMFRNVTTGLALKSEEAKTLAVIAKAKGYAVVPMCHNHDSKGYCCGHHVVE